MPRSRGARNLDTLDPEAARQVVAFIKRETARRGTAKRVAHQFGVATSTLYDVRRGRRAPTYKLARTLGWRLVPPEEK